MGLKFKIATLAEIPEAIRGMYKQEGNEFVLDVEGAVDKTRVDEFRNNNILLQQQLDKLKDVDPVKYRELMDLDRKVKEKELIEAGKVDEVVNLRVENMRTELNGQLTETTTALQAANAQLSVLMIDRQVQAEAVKLGILPTAMDDILLRARAVYSMDKGQPVPKVDGKVLYGKDGSTPMPMNEWVLGLKKTAPHLFAGAAGSGAGGGRGHGHVDTSKMSPLQKIEAGLSQGGLVGALPGEGG